MCESWSMMRTQFQVDLFIKVYTHAQHVIYLLCHMNHWKLWIKVTGYSLLINYSWAILSHYFAKSGCWIELSFMVLCKIDKYFNQLSFKFSGQGWRWDLAPSCLQLEFGNFWIQIASPENIRRIVWRALFVDQNLLEGGSESFFAYLPRIGWGEPLYLRNRAIFAFKRTTSSYVSSNAWQVGKKTLWAALK